MLHKGEANADSTVSQVAKVASSRKRYCARSNPPKHSDIRHNTRLNLLQLGGQFIPNPLLRFHALRAPDKRRNPGGQKVSVAFVSSYRRPWSNLLLEATIRNKFPMRLRTRLRGPEEIPAPDFGRSCEQKLQDVYAPVAFTRELRVAKAWAGEVEDDVGIFLLLWLHPGSEFPAVEDFEELGHGISNSIWWSMAAR